jgi:hypothetical protein
MTRFLFLTPLVLLGACASMSDNGWQGDNAQPFDAAKEKCEAEAAGVPKGEARRQTFEACMAGQGWHRR